MSETRAMSSDTRRIERLLDRNGRATQDNFPRAGNDLPTPNVISFCDVNLDSHSK